MNETNWSMKKAFSIIASLLMIISLLAPGFAVAESTSELHQSVKDSQSTAETKVSEGLLEEFEDDEKVTFLVKFSEKADSQRVAEEVKQKSQLNKVSTDKAKLNQRSAVIDNLESVSLKSQKNVVGFLEKEMKKGNVEGFESFHIVNGMAVTATKKIAEKIAGFAEVEKILPNEIYQINETVINEEEAPKSTLANVEWSIERVKAPQVWEMGIDGTGTVVASIDTGVQWDHPALKEKYRGYTKANGSVNHAYSWFDATSGRSVPYDDDGHGTHVKGTMVGSEPNGSNQVGVAPGAKWIAVKAFTDEGGSTWNLLAAAQWILAPGGRVDMAPDVVNNSWGGGPGLNEWYRDVVIAWRAAEIFPEFSAGNTTATNSGGPGSVSVPANYPESFATGATDSNNRVASFSLRGPSPYGLVKPDISAPGVNIRSSVPGGGYRGMNGTSMAGPAVSGVAALLRQANPDISVSEMEEVLLATATPLTDWQYPVSPNNGYGYGLVNAYEAVISASVDRVSISGKITNEKSGKGISGATIQIVDTGIAPVETDGNGNYSISAFPGTYTLKVNARDYHSKEIDITVVEAGIEVDVALEPHFTYPGGEIGYDDGTAENARVYNGSGNGFAVKMALPEDKNSAIVTDGVFRFWGNDWPNPGGTAFAVEVWDASGLNGDPGSKLAGPINATALRDGNWTVVDLSDHNIAVDGDFYMVYIQTQSNLLSPGLASDENSPNANRGYQFTTTSGFTPSPRDHGNYMIRARVAYEIGETTITSPVEGLLTNEAEIVVEGTASPTTSIQLTNNGVKQGTAVTEDDGNFAIQAELAEGANVLTAITSSNGTVIEESDPVTVTLDTKAPELTIDSPKNGDITNQETVTVEGTVSDMHLDFVKVNGEKAKVTGESYTKDIILDEGANEITVVAHDKAGNTKAKSVSVTAIYAAPVIKNLLPSTDQYVQPTDEVEISFTSDSKGGEASFAVQLPPQSSTKNAMEEVEPGFYKGTWTVPKNVDVQGAIIKVEITDVAGNKSTQEAKGKLLISSDQMDRISGDDRYLTSLKISQNGWKKSDTVILAQGNGFADALAGVPLAQKLDAPVLLTLKDRLYQETLNEIKRLDAKNVIILGGPAAVSDSVTKALQKEGLKVERIAGTDRFETAAKIALKVAPTGVEKAAVVNGLDFPDALSVASHAAKLGLPILLTQTNTLPKATKDAIDSLGVSQTIVVGGTTVVSNKVKDSLPRATRLGGKDRYETNVNVANYFGGQNKHVYVATGKTYADALTGAVLAAKKDSAVILVHDRIPEVVTTYITNHNVDQITIFGGENAVNRKVSRDLLKLIQ